MLTLIITTHSALDLGGAHRQKRAAAAAAAAAAAGGEATVRDGAAGELPLQSAQAGEMLAKGSSELLSKLSREAESGAVSEQPRRGWRSQRGQRLTGRRAAQLLHHAAGGGNSLDVGSANSSSTDNSVDEEQQLSSEEEGVLEAATSSSGSSGKGPSPQMPPLEVVEQVLQSSNEWQFDAFALADATNGHPLSALAFFLFTKQGLVEHYSLRPTILARFLRRIEQGYRTNPYHNATHASDVLQTMHCIITRGGLMPGYVDPMHLMACYTAAVSGAGGGFKRVWRPSRCVFLILVCCMSGGCVSNAAAGCRTSAASVGTRVNGPICPKPLTLPPPRMRQTLNLCSHCPSTSRPRPAGCARL
jgi:hypothetical protein